MKLELKPTSVIKARLGLNAGGKVQKYFTQRCAHHMDKYVPKQSGEQGGKLRTKIEVEDDGIIYKSPYAHYQYKGELYVDPKTKKGAMYSEEYGFWSRPNVLKVPSGEKLKYHTPGTGSYWDKRMWSAEKDTVIKEVQRYFDRGCK